VSQPAAIVDTNVVVAGLLTVNAASPVARMLDGMLAAAFPLVVSEALLAEYHAALLRPHLRKLHGLAAADIETLLTQLAKHALVLWPLAAPPAPDPGDQLLQDLLAVRAGIVLVTGDKRLMKDMGMKSPVVLPAVLLARSQP